MDRFLRRRPSTRLCRRLANQKEAGEVAFVVFNARLQNLAGIFARRVTSRNCSCILQILGDHMLHAACRVVERYRLDLGMVAKEIAALVERHGMRKNPAHLPSFTPGAAITL